ncbi:hypothetical protein GLS40_08105 [Pseudooceanicola sp. 216_PA32_1]|uniref:Lipoprotein n=2 Tax=Pseudooceanicola pacificus TaxID=2676438 RepID=A0A844WDW4_9RHOB|nr:hypothetical protein [Pseudooceanicola pacificus]
MRKTLALTLIATLVVGGCGTRLNPFNWFGRAQSAPVTASGETNPLIPERAGQSMMRRNAPYTGQPVDTITGLTIERLPGGAIIRVEGVSAIQGAYKVRLIPDVEASGKDVVTDGVLSYTLMAQLPERAAVGTEASRRITAARFVNDQTLAQVRTVRVSGARNSMTTRR